MGPGAQPASAFSIWRAGQIFPMPGRATESSVMANRDKAAMPVAAHDKSAPARPLAALT